MDSRVDIVDNLAYLTCAWRDCGVSFTRDARQVDLQLRGGKRKFFLFATLRTTRGAVTYGI